MKTGHFLARGRATPKTRMLAGLVVILAFTGLFFTAQVPKVGATTSTSWNAKVQCTPLIVRISDITANHTGSASLSASPFNPGITTTVSGGTAKRWLTPGSTPPGWNAPGPSCTNSNGKALFVEIDGIERAGITTEDSASSYDRVNGGTSHATTYDHTFNIFDPSIVPNYSSSCTSSTDPTCYGRIHSEIDHDWLAASYCGTGTTCDPTTLASQTGYASTKIDIQGFVYWDPGHVSAGYHNFNGWEIHPVTAWRLSGQQDFSLTTNPSSVSLTSGSTGSFIATTAGTNGFTSSVSLSTASTPSTGITTSCSPSSIAGGSGTSTCTLNSSTPGTYTVTVTGTSGSLVHSSSVSVTVTPTSTPNFSISANPTSLSLVQGFSGTSTINLNSISSFTGTVSLAAHVPAAGPLAGLSPASVSLAANGRATSTLNVTTGSASTGSYAINVTGTSGAISHSAIVTVSVTPPQDFTISVSPTSLTLGQGSSGPPTPAIVTTSGDRTWFESSYLSDSFYAQGLIWLFYEDSSVSCESMGGCLFYTSSSNGSSWTTPVNLNVHVTDSDFSVYSDGSNVYYVRYDESTFQTNCGRNVQFRTGSLLVTGTINWQPEQTALAAGTSFTYQNEEIIVDSNGQAWIAMLSDSRGGCGGTGTELPQIIHSSGTNYASWTTPFTLSTAHSNNWHIALVSLGAGQIYASFWLANADLHGRLFNGSTWGSDEQISGSSVLNDVNAWLFNSGSNVYAIFYDNGPETFNFASRSSTGAWTASTIGVGESRTGSSLSSSYYSFPDAASYDPTHNQFYLFWMNQTNQRIDQWVGSGGGWTKTTKLIGTSAVPYPDSITSFITPSPLKGGIFYTSGSGPFTINFAALPLSGSTSGTFTVTVTGHNGFTGAVTVSATINPSTGLTVTCTPTSISGGSGTSTCTVKGTTAGNYNVTETGTSASLAHSASVSVTVLSSSPDFTISSNPTSVAVNTAVTGTSTLTVAAVNGFAGTIALAILANSTNLVCSLSTSSITGGSGSPTLSCHGSTVGNYLATVTGTSGSLSHSVTVGYHVRDYTVTAAPTVLSIVVGATGNSSLTVSPLNGFNSGVTLAITMNSTSLTCTLSQTIITGGSGTSNLSCKANIPGNYLATVTGTSSGLSNSVSITYHVTAAADFTVTANPTSVFVNTSVLGNATISIVPRNGFTTTVALAVSTNSTGLSCTLSSSNIASGSGSSILSCETSTAGNFLANVTGTAGGMAHSVTVTYHAILPKDFAISASPTIIVTDTGVFGNSTVTVVPINGFTGTVSLGVTTNSTNLSCSLTPAALGGGSGTSALSCGSSVGGNYLATVTGMSGSLAHSATVAYAIIGVPDFTVQAAPTDSIDDVSVQGNSTITVASLNGFNGTVNLAVSIRSSSLVCGLSSAAVASGAGFSTLSCVGSQVGSYIATVTGTNGTLVHNATVTFHIVDFAISASPTSVTTTGSLAGASVVTVAPLNGFSGTVALSVTTNSSSLNCSLATSSITGGSGSSGLSCAGLAPGNYHATVTGTNGALIHPANVTYHVVLAPDFTISANPTSLSGDTGVVGNSNITVASVNSFTGTVTLTVSSNSTSLLCALSPTTVSAVSGSSALSCHGTAAGNYLATVNGTSGTLSHTVLVQFQVEDFAISANPNTVAVGSGVSGNATITIASLNVFANPVILSVGTNSTNLTCSLSSANLTHGSGISTLSCSSSPAGNYLATVTGVSGSLSHSATVTYHVSPPPNIGISANPTSLNLTQGSSGSSVVTLTSLNGFSGTISLSVLVSPNGPVAGLSPTSLVLAPNGVGGSTLNLNSTAASPGSYTINVTATSSSLSHSVIVNLTVNAFVKPSYALVASYEGFVYKLYPNNTLSLVGQPVTTQLRAVAWKPDGSYALIVGDAATLIKYDGTTLTKIPTSAASTVNFLSIAWRPDGSYALVGGSAGVLLKFDGTTVSQIPSSYSVSFRAISWNPGGNQALLVSYFGQVFLYQSAGSLTKLVTGASQSFASVAWNPNGSYALVAGDGGGIYRYNGTLFQALNTAGVYSSTLTVRFISFNPTGTLALLVGDSGLALLVGDSGLALTYDGTTLTALPVLTSNTLYSVSWSGNTAYIVGGVGTILTYSSGVLASVPSGSFSGFRGVAWKPN